MKYWQLGLLGLFLVTVFSVASWVWGYERGKQARALETDLFVLESCSWALDLCVGRLQQCMEERSEPAEQGPDRAFFGPKVHNYERGPFRPSGCGSGS